MRKHNIIVEADFIRETIKNNGGMTGAAKRLEGFDKRYSMAVLARAMIHMSPFEREVFAGVISDRAESSILESERNNA